MIIKEPTRTKIELEQYETKALDGVISLLEKLKSKIGYGQDYDFVYTQDCFHNDKCCHIDENQIEFVIDFLDYLENRNLYLEKSDE